MSPIRRCESKINEVNPIRPLKNKLYIYEIAHNNFLYLPAI